MEGEGGGREREGGRGGGREGEGGEEEREERKRGRRGREGGEGGRERWKKGRIKHSSLQMEEEEEEEEEVYYSELMYTMELVLKFKVPALNSLYTIIVAGLHVEVCLIYGKRGGGEEGKEKREERLLDRRKRREGESPYTIIVVYKLKRRGRRMEVYIR